MDILKCRWFESNKFIKGVSNSRSIHKIHKNKKTLEKSRVFKGVSNYPLKMYSHGNLAPLYFHLFKFQSLFSPYIFMLLLHIVKKKIISVKISVSVSSYIYHYIYLLFEHSTFTFFSSRITLPKRKE